MRDNLREQLDKEITRKQFLQYMAAAMLTMFGLNNLVSLLTGNKPQRIVIETQPQTNHDGFGTRKFGA